MPLAAALLGAVLLTNAHGQTDSAFYRPLTLAPADANSSGGGGAGDETAREAELAKESLNLVADPRATDPVPGVWQRYP